MGSPFYFAGELSFELCETRMSMMRRHFGWGIFWLLAYAFAAIGLLVSTLLTFDRFLGRVETGMAPLGRSRSRPVVLVKVPRLAGPEFAKRSVS